MAFSCGFLITINTAQQAFSGSRCQGRGSLKSTFWLVISLQLTRLTWRRYILIFNLPIMANIAFVNFLRFINWDIPNYLWRCLQVQVSGIQFWHFWLKSCSLSKPLVLNIFMMTVSVHSELYCFSAFTVWWILRVFVHRKSVPCTLHLYVLCLFINKLITLFLSPGFDLVSKYFDYQARPDNSCTYKQRLNWKYILFHTQNIHIWARPGHISFYRYQARPVF